MPLSGRMCYRLGFAIINPHTKFEVSTFTQYEDMKGNAKCRIDVVWELEVTTGYRQCHHSIDRLRLPIRLQ